MKITDKRRLQKRDILRQGYPNFLLGGPHAVRWTSAGAGCLKKMYSHFFSNPARGMLHKREKEVVELRPKTFYTHIQLHIYIMSMVATQHLIFLSLVERAAGRIWKKEWVHFFEKMRGHRPDSFHKFKSSRGPDKILSRARFGPRAGLWTCLS